MRIITVEEHFHHPEVMARVQELAGPWPPAVVADDGFSRFLQGFMPEKDSAEQLGGHRLAHMDRVGIESRWFHMAQAVPAGSTTLKPFSCAEE